MLANILAMGTTTGTTSSSASSGMGSSILVFVLIIAVFYVLIIRPQNKRDKETKAMMAAIKKGDKIVTIGGIMGTVAVVKEQSIVVKVDDNARIEFQKAAISRVLESKTDPKKTEEKIEKPAETKKKAGRKAKKEAEAAATQETATEQLPAAEEKVEEAPAAEQETPAVEEEPKA